MRVFSMRFPRLLFLASFFFLALAGLAYSSEVAWARVGAGESLQAGGKLLKLTGLSQTSVGGVLSYVAYFDLLGDGGKKLDSFRLSDKSGAYEKNGVVAFVASTGGSGGSSYAEVAFAAGGRGLKYLREAGVVSLGARGLKLKLAEVSPSGSDPIRAYFELQSRNGSRLAYFALSSLSPAYSDNGVSISLLHVQPLAGGNSFAIVDSLPPLPAPGECTDSDGGKALEVAGNASNGTGSSYYFDSCLSETELLEYYCGEAGLDRNVYSCPEIYGPASACRDGACVKEREDPKECAVSCFETDRAFDPETRGIMASVSQDGNSITEDFCLDRGRLGEYFCETAPDGSVVPDRRTVDCPYGCENGACKRQPPVECKDSDGGADAKAQGTTTLFRGDEVLQSESDRCSSELAVVEYFCVPEDPTIVDSFGNSSIDRSLSIDRSPSIDRKEIACPSRTLCTAGACRPVRDKYCEDSDGGREFFTRGVVTQLSGGRITVRADKCITNGKRLREYFCKNGRIESEHTRCDCKDGACAPAGLVGNVPGESKFDLLEGFTSLFEDMSASFERGAGG